MDEIKQEINPNPNLNQNQPVAPRESNFKNLVFIVIGIVFLLVIFSGGAYYMGAQNSKLSGASESTPQGIKSPTPTPSSNLSGTKPQNLAPITSDTVSYGYKDTNLLMRYRNKVYSYDSIEKRMNDSEPESKYPNITWYGLVQAPQSVNEARSYMAKINGGVFDEILNFSPLPNNNFVFVMRWDRITGNNQTNWDLPIYYFDSKEQSLEKLVDNTWPSEKDYPVPFFNSISLDNKNIAFDMYGCWNCGAGYPEIKLINIQTKATKNLGRIIEFKWTGDDSYSYKDYKEIACPNEPGGPGPCVEDSKNLPLKYGGFK